MRYFIFLLDLLYFTTAGAQPNEKMKAFNAADYPKQKYTVKTDTSSLNTVQVIITSVKNKSNTGSPFSCRSWLTVKKEGKLIKGSYYDNIDAVGGCSGLFIPKTQPIKDLFLISKFGDYNGELIIIDSAGKFTKEAGGKFYVSKDSIFLFSSFDSDLSGVTIYNTKTRKTIFSKELEDDFLEDWHFQDGKYYAAVIHSQEKGGKDKMAVFNPTTNKFSIIEKAASYLQAKNKLKVYNDFQKAGNCNCGAN